jgi:YHS domain-containing protein
MAFDPVCGREVHPKQSQWLLSYHGSTYHFCSGECAHRFNAYPEEYLASERATEPKMRKLPAPRTERKVELALLR